MGAYIVEIQGIDSGFSFPYPVMFWVAGILARFTTPEHAMAVTVTFFNGLTLLSLKWFADSALKVRGGQDWKRGAAATAIAVTLLLVSMLYPLTYLGNYQEMGEVLVLTKPWQIDSPAWCQRVYEEGGILKQTAEGLAYQTSG